MLGIAVLFFLGLWVLITLFAMRIGYKQLKNRWAKPYAGLIGAFLGFMLTMGGLIVYWTIEYIQIQRTVTHLCETEGGIKVYVTPEEWRQQIGEEWAKLYPYVWEEQRNYPKGNIVLSGRVYSPSAQRSSRIVVYADYDSSYDYILGNYKVYYDIQDKRPLFEINSFNSGVGAIANTLSGLKFWVNSIEDCYPSSGKNERNDLIRQYINYGAENE